MKVETKIPGLARRIESFDDIGLFDGPRMYRDKDGDTVLFFSRSSVVLLPGVPEKFCPFTLDSKGILFPLTELPAGTVVTFTQP